MRPFIITLFLLAAGIFVFAQSNYPNPEFINEIYQYRKDSAIKLLRLEKASSKMNNKVKMAGFGGAESSYDMEGDKSTTRVAGGKDLSFIFSNSSSSHTTSSPKKDSMMRANGMDPAMLKEMNDMMDPSNMITLYRVEPGKDQRKVVLQKSPGAMPFAGKKSKSSDKYTFSVKKIREGYWELIVDKSLPRGEYAFSMMNMGMGNMDGGTLLFAFGID